MTYVNITALTFPEGAQAEIEKRYRPGVVPAAESDAKMRETFALWGLDYQPSAS